MKIIHVLECWGNAGTERYVKNLVNANVKKQGSFEFLIIGENTHNSSSQELPGPVNEFSQSNNPKLDIIKYILSNRSKDYIYHLHLYTSIFPIALLLRLLRIKCVLTYHLPLSQWSTRHKVFWILSGYLANKKIVVSNYIKNEFSKYFSTDVIYPPVFTSSDNFSIVDSSCMSKFTNIVCIGRLENKQKDWLTLVRAIAELTTSDKNKIKITIIGEGPDRDEIEDLIKKEDLQETINLTGHLDAFEVFAYLDSASISILPSKFEGFGMSAVESMTRGVLTITSNFPASFDYINDGVTGFHFKISDHTHLNLILQRVINDDKLRMKVALNGSKFSQQKFNDLSCAKKYHDIYSSLF